MARRFPLVLGSLVLCLVALSSTGCLAIYPVAAYEVASDNGRIQVAGAVTDLDGDPLHDVHVWVDVYHRRFDGADVIGEDSEHTQIVLEDGRFEFDRRNVMAIHLRFSKEGYYDAARGFRPPGRVVANSREFSAVGVAMTPREAPTTLEYRRVHLTHEPSDELLCGDFGEWPHEGWIKQTSIQLEDLPDVGERLLCARLVIGPNGQPLVRLTGSGDLGLLETTHHGPGDPALALKTAPPDGYRGEVTFAPPEPRDELYFLLRRGDLYGKLAVNVVEIDKAKRGKKRLFVQLHAAMQPDGSTALETNACWTQGWDCGERRRARSSSGPLADPVG